MIIVKRVVLLLTLLMSLALCEPKFPYVPLEIGGTNGLWFDGDTAYQMVLDLKELPLVISQLSNVNELKKIELTQAKKKARRWSFVGGAAVVTVLVVLVKLVVHQ